MKSLFICCCICWSILLAGQQAKLGNPYGHNDVVTALGFSTDGQYLMPGSMDGNLSIWDVDSVQQFDTLITINETDWVVLGPNRLFDTSPNANRLAENLLSAIRNVFPTQ